MGPNQTPIITETVLEQMSDCNEVIPITDSRKKRRGSSFRFSSKKVLNCSRLKWLAKARGCDVTTVTRMLSYPSLMPSEVGASDFYGSATISCKLPDLLTVQELEEERKEIANVGYTKDSENHKTVSRFSLFLLRY